MLHTSCLEEFKYTPSSVQWNHLQYAQIIDSMTVKIYKIIEIPIIALTIIETVIIVITTS